MASQSSIPPSRYCNACDSRITKEAPHSFARSYFHDSEQLNECLTCWAHALANSPNRITDSTVKCRQCTSPTSVNFFSIDPKTRSWYNTCDQHRAEYRERYRLKESEKQGKGVVPQGNRITPPRGAVGEVPVQWCEHFAGKDMLRDAVEEIRRRKGE